MEFRGEGGFIHVVDPSQASRLLCHASLFEKPPHLRTDGVLPELLWRVSWPNVQQRALAGCFGSGG